MEVLNATAAAQCTTAAAQTLVYSALLSALVQMTAAPDEAERRSYPADVGAEPGRLRAEYDWLVVGGGASGCALAARLADRNPAWSVLLLEAGGDPDHMADIPRLYPRLQATQMDWQLRTEPQPGSCLAYGEGGCPWSRARVLGGSTTMGPGLYHRASARDFDRWAQTDGCHHWAAEHMLRAFKAVEDYQPADAAGDHYGVGGELAVEPFAEDEPLRGALLEAVVELNQSLVEDLNAWPAGGSGAAPGFGLLPGTVRNGTRWNTARAFLRKERHNLHVLKHALVTKVLIDPETMTALGVEYERDGETGMVRASREVILSAGAVGSAQLLMLSGVGPADHLQEVGIPLLKDLPVGYNLQDHVTYRGLLLVEEFVGQKESSDAFMHMAEVYEYLLYRAGPLSSPGYHSLAGFIRSGEDTDDDAPGYPDVGIFLFGLESRHRDWILQRQRELGWSEEALSGLDELLDRGDAVVVAPTPLRPFSRGRVLLRGADPRLPPRVQPGYLQDPRDVDTMLAGIRFALQLGRSRAAHAVQLRVRDLPLEACREHAPLSEAYWRCALPLLTESLHQPAGTARMGSPEDPNAVVDCNLRVKGVSRLRVADASVMPTIVSGPLDATSIAIGTKAADILAEDWE